MPTQKVLNCLTTVALNFIENFKDFKIKFVNKLWTVLISFKMYLNIICPL